MSKLPKAPAAWNRASIPHFRAYTSGVATSGDRTFTIRGGASPDRPPINALMNEGDVIAEDEIRVLSARLPFPLNADEVGELAWALNFMRVTMHAKNAVPSHQSAMWQQITKNIGALLQDLPQVIEDGRKFGSPGAAPALDALENLHSAAKFADAWLALRAANWDRKREPKAKQHASWHDDAVYLSLILEKAADRSGKAVSFTKPTAPAVIFIDESLKRAHVSHGGPEAIAREMARYKKRTRFQRKNGTPPAAGEPGLTT